MCNDKPFPYADAVMKKLSLENVSGIQSVIDVDKYERSMLCGRDLCGTYAPFCEVCDKSSMYPCANAYLKFLSDEKDCSQPEPAATPEEVSLQSSAPLEESANVEDALPENAAEVENALPQEEAEAATEPESKPSVEEKDAQGEVKKRRIRIAVAKKRK